MRTVLQLLGRWADGPNIIAHFVKPVLEWVAQCSSFAPWQLEHTPGENPSDSTAQLIDRLLLCAQGILALPPPSTNPDLDSAETPDRFIRDHTRLITQITAGLKVHDVRALLGSVASEAVHAPPAELEQRLARVLPFIDTYLALVRGQLARHCAWTKSLFKLDYVVCSVVRTIARDGFCKPSEAGEGEAGEAGAQDAGGVGLGDGAGSQNVSKEIEDESQVEGLQGDADADEDVERAEEGDALEMSEDFGGKMQDVPENADEEGEDDREDDDEPEEQVGDLDAADPSAVDEKLWGDEGGPDDGKQDEGKADDHSTKQQEKESEMVAKEEDRGRSSKDTPNSKDQNNEAQEETQEAEGDEPIEEDMAEELPAEEAEHEQHGGAPLDDFVPEANTLDLPDDLDFGKEQGKDDDSDDDMQMDDAEGDEDGRLDEERPGEEIVDEADEDDDMDVDTDVPPTAQEDAPLPDGQSEEPVDGATAQPDLHAGAGQDSGEAGDQAMADSTQGEGGQGLSTSSKDGGVEEFAEREQYQRDESVQDERSGES